MAGIFHAVFLLVFILVAGRLLALVPMTALAAVLLMVAWGMSEYDRFIALVRTDAGERGVLVLTFLLTVFVDLTVDGGLSGSATLNSATVQFTATPEPGTTSPIRVDPSARDDTASASSGPLTSTIPMPMLKVANMSASLASVRRRSSSKIGGSVQVPRSMRAPRPGGTTRGRFSSNPPPVMWAAAWTNRSRERGRTSGT